MSTPIEAPHTRIRFEPALEGLRGFALLGMLCYHSEFSWAKGGFLPIATFFTLSGYLITSLFLSEWTRNGRIALLPFWSRRFRRLMPAALFTLLAMSAFGALVATPSQVERLGDDVRWALFYGANWHFLFSNASYTALFEAPSPVHHFWSLAIEEQFYLVFPLIAAGGLAIGKGSRRVLGALLGGLVMASILTSTLLTNSGASIDRMYYGTDTRMAEILLGAVAATWFFGRTVSKASTQRLIQLAGVLAIVLMVLSWSVVDLQAKWLYRGGFAGYTLLSVVVIAAAVQPAGPIRVLLSIPAMRWIGRVSYGAYLFHWPIYLLLSVERTGLGAASLFALRFGVTFGLAGASYRFLESPIRTGIVLTGWRPYVATLATFAAVLLAVASIPKPQAALAVDQDAMETFLETKMRGHIPPIDPPPPSLFNEIPRLALYGDSTALMLNGGLQFLQSQTGTTRLSRGAARLGCGVARLGLIRTGAMVHRETKCHDFAVSWARSIREEQPDIALVLAAAWDIRDRQLPGDPTWHVIGDPVLDRYLRSELVAAVDVLSKDGSLVIWLTHPALDVRLFGKIPEVPYPSSDPIRIDRFNKMIFDLELARPGKVRVVDLRAYMRTLPGGEMDQNYRPDGTHLTHAAAYHVAKDWLIAEILRVYRDAAAAAKAREKA